MTMRKIITFLGRRPQSADYLFNGKVYSGYVFAEALRQFVDYDLMLVCNTEEAHQDAWPVLEKLQDPRIQEVRIPRSKSTAEMWVMFDNILEHIQPGDTVIFDITHGLRSLPFLVFLFAAYLKTAVQVTIEAVYYGAFELGDAQKGKPAPVIDLSEFVTMLDWLTATDQFIQTGDARRLAGLLGREPRERKSATYAAKALTRVSQAALLCQPLTLMREVQGLETSLQAAKDDLAKIARPFSVLSNQITNAFRPFGANFPEDIPASLQAEFNLIEWYYQNKQLIQAMSLGREWLIDAITYRLGREINLQPEIRAPMERAISGIALVGRPFLDGQTGEQRIFTPEDLNEPGRIIYNSWLERQQLIETWNLLSQLRNTLDHAEHQANRMGLNKVATRADKIMPLLRSLARQWGIADHDPGTS